MSDLISETSRSFIPLAVLGASLAGSLHCATMCGPLVTATARGFRSVASYHAGRLLSYAALGALAGELGERIFRPGIQGFVQLASALVIGATFILLGFGLWRGKAFHLFPARWLSRLLPKLMKRNDGENDVARAVGVGLLSAFLPCGWLHSFVLAAITLRSAASGAALLGVFWLGTLPALTAGPLIFARAIRPLLRQAPRISGTLLILAGIATVGMRMAPRKHSMQHVAPKSSVSAPVPTQAEEPSCHHAM